MFNTIKYKGFYIQSNIVRSGNKSIIGGYELFHWSDDDGAIKSALTIHAAKIQITNYLKKKMKEQKV